ncbi:short-chain dehydrogenase [Penicillium malachiteum]|uniref:short-chain dehydrogenase n=1 Tax=Penicillium malachiteum TaxID=1324776 RepID=UPI002547B6EA|nr:short-chain dehydrogenase [Penicillium malachiteum]KAJ5737892.1 short-chain dehydrogenase [Penicillium malachiteum]
MRENVWDQQVDLNLKSVYLTTHFVLPIMEKQETGGAVVNVSSRAIMQFTKATAVIYADRQVRLNTVVPGLIYTPYTRELAKRYTPGGDEAGYIKIRDDQVPMKRMGDSWDVANATLFLVADESRYITGQELVVDGGITSSTGRV